MIKNLIIYLSLAGLIVMVTKVMNSGLGKQWDEVGLIIFMLITMLLIVDHKEK
jgi:hypothetical protein